MNNTASNFGRIGRCTLVGAGPGDPELLTIKAVKAIASATVLFVDDLVNADVLVHAQPDARIVHVGKRGGCHSTPQAFIHKLMVQAVQAGEPLSAAQATIDNATLFTLELEVRDSTGRILLFQKELKPNESFYGNPGESYMITIRKKANTVTSAIEMGQDYQVRRIKWSEEEPVFEIININSEISGACDFVDGLTSDAHAG